MEGTSGKVPRGVLCNNFRAIHRFFQLNNRVIFRLRDNDIIIEKKITRMNKKIFHD